MKFYYFNNIVEERIRRLSKDFFDRMVNNRDFVLKEKEKLIVVVFFSLLYQIRLRLHLDDTQIIHLHLRFISTE